MRDVQAAQDAQPVLPVAQAPGRHLRELPHLPQDGQPGRQGFRGGGWPLETGSCRAAGKGFAAHFPNWPATHQCGSCLDGSSPRHALRSCPYSALWTKTCMRTLVQAASRPQASRPTSAAQKPAAKRPPSAAPLAAGVKPRASAAVQVGGGHNKVDTFRALRIESADTHRHDDHPTVEHRRALSALSMSTSVIVELVRMDADSLMQQ